MMLSGGQMYVHLNAIYHICRVDQDFPCTIDKMV